MDGERAGILVAITSHECRIELERNREFVRTRI